MIHFKESENLQSSGEEELGEEGKKFAGFGPRESLSRVEGRGRKIRVTSILQRRRPPEAARGIESAGYRGRRMNRADDDEGRETAEDGPEEEEEGEEDHDDCKRWLYSN